MPRRRAKKTAIPTLSLSLYIAAPLYTPPPPRSHKTSLRFPLSLHQPLVTHFFPDILRNKRKLSVKTWSTDGTVAKTNHSGEGVWAGCAKKREEGRRKLSSPIEALGACDGGSGKGYSREKAAVVGKREFGTVVTSHLLFSVLTRCLPARTDRQQNLSGHLYLRCLSTS